MSSCRSGSSAASSSGGVASSSSRSIAYTNADGAGGYCEASVTSPDGQTNRHRQVVFVYGTRSIRCTARATASGQGATTSAQIELD